MKSVTFYIGIMKMNKGEKLNLLWSGLIKIKIKNILFVLHYTFYYTDCCNGFCCKLQNVINTKNIKSVWQEKVHSYRT